MKYQIVLQVFYSVISVYILDVLPLRKINFYITAFDWLRMNNKCGFRLDNRFAKRKFYKFFIRKDKPRFLSFSLPNPFFLRINNSVTFSFVQLLYIVLSMAKYNLLTYLSNIADSSGLVAAINNQAYHEGDSIVQLEALFIPTFQISKAQNQKRSCQHKCFEKYPLVDYIIAKDAVTLFICKKENLRKISPQSIIKRMSFLMQALKIKKKSIGEI